jgi:hypothetical protein
MLELDSRKTNNIPQECDTNACCANRFAVTKSLPNILDGSPIISQVGDMGARGNKDSIKERRALSFEVMVSLDSRPFDATASSFGMDFATAWTDYDSLGICT